MKTLQRDNDTLYIFIDEGGSFYTPNDTPAFCLGGCIIHESQLSEINSNLEEIKQEIARLRSIIDNPDQLYNPNEWHKFQLQIRNRYTMESEKEMFDAILHGKTIEEALAMASAAKSIPDDDIELF